MLRQWISALWCFCCIVSCVLSWPARIKTSTTNGHKGGRHSKRKFQTFYFELNFSRKKAKLATDFEMTNAFPNVIASAYLPEFNE